MPLPASISFTFTPAAADFWGFWRYQRQRRLRRLGWLVALCLGYVVWGLLENFSTIDPRAFSMPLPRSLSEAVQEVVFFLLATAMCWLPLLATGGMLMMGAAIGRFRRRNALHAWLARGVTHVTASPDELRLQDANSDTRYRWTAFENCREIAPGLLLHVTAFRSLHIPRRADNADALQALLLHFRRRPASSEPFVIAAMPGQLILPVHLCLRDYASASPLHPLVRALQGRLYIIIAILSASMLLLYALIIFSSLTNGFPIPSLFTAPGFSYHFTLYAGLLVWLLPWVAQRIASFYGWRRQRRFLGAPRTVVISRDRVVLLVDDILGAYPWTAFREIARNRRVLVFVFLEPMLIILPRRDVPAEQQPLLDALLSAHQTPVDAFPVSVA